MSNALMSSFKVAVGAAVLLCFVQCFAPVMCGFTFEVWAINYTNTQSEKEDGYCCDNNTVSDNCERYRCDNLFHFCLRNSDKTSHDNNVNHCPWGSWTTRVIYHDIDSFNFPPPMDHTRVRYRLNYTGSAWPGSFQLYIQVWDFDNGTNDDKVNDIYVDECLSVNSSWTTKMYTGSVHRYTTVLMTLSFRVQCNSNYYGSNCTTYCVPMDNNNGHYTCGSNGQKICQSGWTNSSENCRTPTTPPLDYAATPNLSPDGTGILSDTGSSSSSGTFDPLPVIGAVAAVVSIVTAVVTAVVAVIKYITSKRDPNKKARQYDYRFELLMIGDSNVGKTLMVCRYEDKDGKHRNSFSKTVTTIDSAINIHCIGIQRCLTFRVLQGKDFRTKTIDLERKKIKLVIWDASGQERLFDQFVRPQLPSVKGIILVYDITCASSFDSITTKWLQHASSDVERLLVGNKCDLEKKRAVESERGEELARSHGIPFMETSAKTGHNINEAFEQLARLTLGKDDKPQQDKQKGGSKCC